MCQECIISNSTPKASILRRQPAAQASLLVRLRKRFLKVISERRTVRYGLLSLNMLLLSGIVTFVVKSPSAPDTTRRSALVTHSGAGVLSDPLDQLSSADIAVNAARLVNMAEEPAVKNQAESVSSELETPPVYTAVIAKPQAVATDLKSRHDIQTYVVQAGDTVSSIAAKFNVTSDSIKWSNNIVGDNVAAGTTLTIPPVNGFVYTVKVGDTPDTLAQRFRASKDQIIAYNDAELSGLKVGEKIIIPNGQIPAPVSNSYAYSGGFSWGRTAIYGYNGYDFGYCTWYVANKRIQIGRPVPANLGNASTWDSRAVRAGLPVNKTPAYGAAVVTSHRGAGHVAFVERVEADGIWISEMNSSGYAAMDASSPRAGGWNKMDYKFIPMSTAVTYNYIH